MSHPARPGVAVPSRFRIWLPYVLTAVLVWLGWQVVVALLVQRAPVEVAVRVAPGSAQVLSRAAEAELVADRREQAHELAALALARAPFDVRALRVFGLSAADPNAAATDEILTLAGNWSLRDDPAHAWLVNRRLRQGDYVGAFGHADVLARRRPDLYRTIFDLFTTAAASDPRAMPALAARLSAEPDWRPAYLEDLRRAPQAAIVQAGLAQLLERSQAPLTDDELGAIYGDWLDTRRLPGLAALRARLARPLWAPLHDGEFNDPPAPRPFRWTLGSGSGLVAAISGLPEEPGQKALLVQTDGFSSNTIATQLLQLSPGPHRFEVSWRFEAGGRDPSLEWVITCVETQTMILRIRPVAAEAVTQWTQGGAEMNIPAQGCSAQSLQLRTFQGTRRGTVIAWFDRARVRTIGAARSPG